MWRRESARVPNHETISDSTVHAQSLTSLPVSAIHSTVNYTNSVLAPRPLHAINSLPLCQTNPAEAYSAPHPSSNNQSAHPQHQYSFTSLHGAGHPAHYGHNAPPGNASHHHGNAGVCYSFPLPIQQSSQTNGCSMFPTNATIMGVNQHQQMQQQQQHHSQQQQLQQLSTLSLDSAGLYGPQGLTGLGPGPGHSPHRLLPNQPQRQQPQAPPHLKRNKSCYAQYYRYRPSIRQQPKVAPAQQTQTQLGPGQIVPQMNVSGNGTELRTPYHPPLFYRASSPVFDRAYTPQELGGRRPSIREQLGLARSFEDLPVNSSPRLFASPQPRATPTPVQSHPTNVHSRTAVPRRSASSSTSSDEISSPRHTPRQVLISYRNPFDEINSADDDEVELECDPESNKANDDNDPSQAAIDPSCVRTVLLHKFASDKGVPNRRSGGITLSGGLEVGLTSVYISRIAPNSAAAKCGLSPGDEILSADYENFVDGTITCKRAYDILERDREVIVLSILPRRDAFRRSRLRHLSFDWLDPRGRPVSPPIPSPDETPTESLLSSREEGSDDSRDARDSTSSPTSFFTSFRVRAPKLRDLPRAAAAAAQHRIVSKLNNHFSFFKGRKSQHHSTTRSPGLGPGQESMTDSTRSRQVVIHLEQGIDLGLGIRGGIEYGLGVYISRVDPDSLADKAGLKIGDQILSVNRFDFSAVLHDEAVDILRSSSRLSMKVKYVGKVPACQQVTNNDRPVLWSPRHSPNHRYQATPTSTSTSSGLGPELVTSYRTPPTVVTPTTSQPPMSGSPRSRHSPGSSIHQMRGHPHQILILGPPPLPQQNTPQNHHYHHQQTHPNQQHPSQQSQQQPPQTAPPLLRHFHSESHSNSRASMSRDRDTPTLMISGSLERLPLRDVVHDDVSDDVVGLPLRHNDDESEDVPDDIDDDDSLGERYFEREQQFKHLKLMRYQKGLPNSRSEEEEQILEEECLKYLTEKERISFDYYRNEYETKSLDIEQFVYALVELMNTEEKYSIMFHLYHSIKSDDLIRFQELIYAKRPMHQHSSPHHHQHSPLQNSPHHHHHSQQQQQQQQQQQSQQHPSKMFPAMHMSHNHSNFHHSPPGRTHMSVSTSPRQESCESTAFDFMPPTTGELESSVLNNGSPNHGQGLNPIQVDARRFSTQFQNAQVFGNNRLSRSECLMATRSMGSSGTRSPMPNPVAYRKQFMTRRHSSGTSETSVAERQSREYQQAHQYPDPALLPHFGAVSALVGDDRRWSFNVAAGNRRSSNVFNATELRTTSPCGDPGSPVPPPNQLLATTGPQSRKGSHVSVCLTPAGPEVITEITPPSGGTSPSHLGVDGTGNGDVGGLTSGLSGASGPGGVHQHRRNSGNHLIVPDMSGSGGGGAGGGSGPGGVSGTDTEDECFEFPAHLRVRRHRSLPSPTSYTSADVQFASVPPPNRAHQRSASFRLPNHKAITQPNGRWRVQVKKTKSFLGIAIEGGLNVTTQTQPRIISIHNDGAAVLCSDLKVGHIIMEVDGQSTASMNHQQVAAMISRAYYNTPHKDYVEFLVREKSRAEFDLRRSSFMLLNNSFE